MDGWMDGWAVDGQMDEWMDGWLDWIHEYNAWMEDGLMVII